MNKTIKTLILIVVLALIGWAVWFFVPQDAGAPTDDGAPADETPTISLDDIPFKGELPASDIDTSNWETYTNEEFGFRVKYPERWRVRALSDRGYIGFGDRPEDDKVVFNLNIFNSLSDTIKQTPRYDKTIPFERFVFGDIELVKITDRNPLLSYNHYSYIWEKNDNFYSFSSAENLEIGLAMLNTLVFFDK